MSYVERQKKLQHTLACMGGSKEFRKCHSSGSIPLKRDMNTNDIDSWEQMQYMDAPTKYPNYTKAKPAMYHMVNVWGD